MHELILSRTHFQFFFQNSKTWRPCSGTYATHIHETKTRCYRLYFVLCRFHVEMIQSNLYKFVNRSICVHEGTCAGFLNLGFNLGIIHGLFEIIRDLIIHDCFSNPGFDLEIYCSFRTLDNSKIIELWIDLRFDLRYNIKYVLAKMSSVIIIIIIRLSY